MPARQEQRRRLEIGDVAASATPMLFHTVLGSCVSVCMRDPVSGVAGMNHILVPGQLGACERSTRRGVQAMELLINAMMKLGGDRRRFVAKAFGGANVLAGFQTPTVGELNARFVREFLSTDKIPLLAERMGGTQAVWVTFHTLTGRACVHTVDGSQLPTILRDETSCYALRRGPLSQSEEPVLF